MPLSSLHNSLICARGFLLQHTGFWVGSAMSAAEREKVFHAYLQRSLLPQLGCEEARVVPLAHGTQSLAVRIEPRGAPSVVARCEPRRKRRQKAQEYAEITGLMLGAGLDVPRIRHQDFSCDTLGRYGFDVTVEEWISGKHPAPKAFRSEAPLAHLATLMAALHAVRSKRAGYPWRKTKQRTDILGAYYADREAAWFREIERCEFLALTNQQLAPFQQALDERRADLAGWADYSLVHGDLQAYNLIRRDDAPDSGFALIDFDTTHFGFWPWDFVCFHSGIHDLRGAKERLLDLYLEKQTNADAADFHRAWPYLHLWYHLRRTARYARGHRRAAADKSHAKTQDECRLGAEKNWERAREALEAPEFAS